MRPALGLCALIAALSLAGAASAATKLPENGFVVFKDLRTHSVTEVRDKATGRVVSSAVSFGDTIATITTGAYSCTQPSGVYRTSFESYFVNTSSVPILTDTPAALADLRGSHNAWLSFTSDCSSTPSGSDYNAIYGGRTSRIASLAATLSMDGVNVVAFQSLAGTVCDGALACVVVDYKGSKINEADLAFERDLTRYGYQDFWTTDDATWTDAVGGRFAVSDVATHEWGHFAGLDHVEKSPTLTMFPCIHDGAQTLGLGDMKGKLARS